MSEEGKIKSWRFYLWTPNETPGRIAKRGGFIFGVMGLLYLTTQGSLIGDLAAIAATYGEILLIVALFKWLKEKIKKKKAGHF